ncbi:hypothetical protein P0D69_42830 [Paraburkholderia sediminicola]|uniref:hypothetical protein n=1 Tax=Paraburkholderia sediminicola TaxID=458836 RepID=UPI0038B953D0
MKKDASLIAHDYHPDFVLETNGQKQNYDAFAEGHRKVYATDVAYEIRYDDDTWVESPERVAARVWIKTQRPNEAPVEFEVVLIATYVDRKIHRVWELTWPDWTQVKAFENYS